MDNRQGSRSRGSRRRLSARGPREVVFCHQCNHEWYRDEYGLSCPRCDGQITEIIEPTSDPRPRASPNTSPESRDLRGHDPWQYMDDSDSDPDVGDIEEHTGRGPGRNVNPNRRTSRSMPHNNSDRSRRLGPVGVGDAPDDTIRNLQRMFGNLLGSDFRVGESGRSDPSTLFSGPGWSGRTFQVGGNGQGPAVAHETWTFTGRIGGRVDHAPGGLEFQDPTGLFGSMFGTRHNTHIHDHVHHDHVYHNFHDHTFHGGFPVEQGTLPPQMQGLLASLFNPSGDAVHSQEELDRIISQLMEQNPTSNAPGPAPRNDIESLPKRNLDAKMLGPEGKGECSVCMDDVKLGDEVVILPCSHWFHEACASAWLSEHNTCPICRKGISAVSQPDAVPATGPNRRTSIPSPASQQGSPGSGELSNRNGRRLDSIRNAGRMPTSSSSRVNRDESRRGSTPRTPSTQRMPSTPNTSRTPRMSRTSRMPSTSSGRFPDDHTHRESESGRRGDHRSPSYARHRSSNAGGVSSWLRYHLGNGDGRN